MLKRDRYRALRIESQTLREGLKGTHDVSDRGRSVLDNMAIIAKNKRIIGEQKASKYQDPRSIERSSMIISNCMNTIKNTLNLLGADEKSVQEIVAYVEKNDETNVRYNLLKLLSVRNPGMYARKLALFEQNMSNQRG